MSEAHIKVSQLTMAYGDFVIQRDVNFTVNRGDIFIIMEGTTTLTLGGKLDSPNQVQPGEWRAAGITGGKEFKLSKGDVVIVPRGTPHRRISASQDVTLMVVKSFTPAGK